MTATKFIHRFVFTALFGVAFAAWSPATAPACTAKYDPFGALVGCCGADGNPKSEDAVCIQEQNPCKKNKCTAPSGATPGTCDKAASGNTSGHPKCLNTQDFCAVGECYSGTCTFNNNQQASGFDYFCDDGKDCTDEVSCDDENATVLIAPICDRDDKANGTACADNPSAGTPEGECQVGACTDGECTDTPAVDYTDCSGVATEGDCQPRECIAGVCTNQGDPIECYGTLNVCRVWKCTWLSPTVHECTQVKSPAGTDCDTNDFDCKAQTCRTNGSCGNQLALPDEFGQPPRCDSNRDNNTTVLVDCVAGTCDNRGDCEGETYSDLYNGLDCNDTAYCTTHSICVEDPSGLGGTCKATLASDCAASTVDCPLCNYGNCNPAAGAPGCGCP